jgi:hypothetical protein
LAFESALTDLLLGSGEGLDAVRRTVVGRKYRPPQVAHGIISSSKVNWPIDDSCSRRRQRGIGFDSPWDSSAKPTSSSQLAST